MSAVQGSVPSQGVVFSEVLSAKKQGARGDLGESSPGQRLKAAWKNSKSNLGLRAWARSQADSEYYADDVYDWFEAKRPGGGDNRAEERAKRQDRLAELYSQREGKKSKSSMNVPKKETSRSAGKR